MKHENGKKNRVGLKMIGTKQILYYKSKPKYTVKIYIMDYITWNHLLIFWSPKVELQIFAAIDKRYNFFVSSQGE